MLIIYDIFSRWETIILGSETENCKLNYCLSDFNVIFRFSFFDGPPFATGLPHYGHILAGTIKDVITRWAAMDGYYVERRFGWDCHGLPVVCIYHHPNIMCVR